MRFPRSCFQSVAVLHPLQGLGAPLALLVQPAFPVVFAALFVQPFGLGDAGLLGLLLSLGSRACLVVRFHQSLLALRLQPGLVELIVRNIKKIKVRCLVFFLWVSTNILGASLLDSLFQFLYDLIQLALILKVVAIKDSACLLLRLVNQLRLQVLVVFQILLLLHKLLQSHLGRLLLESPAAFLLALGYASQFLLTLLHDHFFRVGVLDDNVPVLQARPVQIGGELVVVVGREITMIMKHVLCLGNVQLAGKCRIF